MKRTNEFLDYCMSFYGKDGIYPTKEITRMGVVHAVCELALNGHKFGGGDTFDREAVRDHILDGYKIIDDSN